MSAAAKMQYKNRSNDVYVQSDLSKIGVVKAAPWYCVQVYP